MHVVERVFSRSDPASGTAGRVGRLTPRATSG